MRATKATATFGAAAVDLRAVSDSMDDAQARVLVTAYYNLQRERIRMYNRARAMQRQGHASQFLEEVLRMYEVQEAEMKYWLDRYSARHPVGEWARTHYGIGPVIAAGLIAYLASSRSTNVSQFWSYAGLNPTQVWEKGQRRPFNIGLKTLCWKIGDSFVKVSGHEESVYGKLYLERRRVEWEKNLRGEFAAMIVGGKAYTRVGGDTESRKWLDAWYSSIVTTDGVISGVPISRRPGDLNAVERVKLGGVHMLPPMIIFARAKRYAVKRFLSHVWAVFYEHKWGVPAPRPWVHAVGGHVDYMEPVRGVRSGSGSESE